TGDTGGTGDTDPVVLPLGASISAYDFRDYSNGDPVSSIIGTDITEQEFLNAAATSNPNLKLLYEGIKNNTKFNTVIQKIFQLAPSNNPPKIVLADDRAVNGGAGIHAVFDPNANELILGQSYFESQRGFYKAEDFVKGILATLVHELTHSEDNLQSIDNGVSPYGPDGAHYGTEILSTEIAYTEGMADFYEAYFFPESFGGQQWFMAACGFRKEDANSTVQSPSYNGKGANLTCNSSTNDFIEYDDASLSADDYFKIEYVFASILLEFSYRNSGGFDIVHKALQNVNPDSETFRDGDSADTLSVFKEIVNVIETDFSTDTANEFKGNFMLIVDALSAFKLTPLEMSQKLGISLEEVTAYYEKTESGQNARDFVSGIADSDVDASGQAIKYNAFQVFDDSFLLSVGFDLSRKDPAVSGLLAGTFYSSSGSSAPFKESGDFLSASEKETIELEHEHEDGESNEDNRASGNVLGF
ncbi:hypothetical protein MJH12_04995, partial [bacterium]|nr:hypothetical protein [bacterium]